MCRRTFGICGPTKPATRLNRRRPSSAAPSSSVHRKASSPRSISRMALPIGNTKWMTPIGESSPAYSRGVVYVGDLGGWLHAVNATDGKKIWAFKAGTEIKSSPVIVGDRVLIGSYDQHLYCVSARNGALLWKLKTNGAVHSTPSVAGDLAFIAGCDELFRAVSISTGKQVFSVSSDAYTGASPALRGATAYYGTFDNEILMVDLECASSRVALSASGTKVSFLFVGCRHGRSSCSRWARQIDPWTDSGRQRAPGLLRLERASNRHRRLRAHAFSSAQMMGGSMFSI